MSRIRKALVVVFGSLFLVCAMLFAAACDLTGTNSKTLYKVEIAAYDTTKGSVTLNDSKDPKGYAAGEEAVVTVEVREGNVVGSVKVNDADVTLDKDGSYKFAVEKNTTVSVVFEAEKGENPPEEGKPSEGDPSEGETPPAEKTYVLTVSCLLKGEPSTEAGSVKLSPEAANNEYKEGTVVTLTPVPNEGYLLTNVAVGGIPLKAENGVYKVTMDSAKTVNVYFGEDDSALPELSVTFTANFRGTWKTVGGTEHTVYVSENRMSLDGVGISSLTASTNTQGEGYDFTLNGKEYQITWLDDMYLKGGVLSLQNYTDGQYSYLVEEERTELSIAENYRGTWYGEQNELLRITADSISYQGSDAEWIADGGYLEGTEGPYGAPVQANVYAFKTASMSNGSYLILYWAPDEGVPVIGNNYFSKTQHDLTIRLPQEYQGTYKGYGSVKKLEAGSSTVTLDDQTYTVEVGEFSSYAIKVGDTKYDISMFNDYILCLRAYSFNKEGLPSRWEDTFYANENHPTDVTLPTDMYGTWKGSLGELVIGENVLTLAGKEGELICAIEMGGEGGGTATTSYAMMAAQEDVYSYAVIFDGVAYTMMLGDDAITLSGNSGNYQFRHGDEKMPAELVGEWSLNGTDTTDGFVITETSATFCGESITISNVDGMFTFEKDEASYTVSVGGEFGPDYVLAVTASDYSVVYYLNLQKHPTAKLSGSYNGTWVCDGQPALSVTAAGVTYGADAAIVLSAETSDVLYNLLFVNGMLIKLRLDADGLKLYDDNFILDYTYTKQAAAASYQVTVEADDELGTYEMTPANSGDSYLEGTLVTLSVLPKKGYEAVVTVNGTEVAPIDSVYAFEVEEDTVVKVDYSWIYTIFTSVVKGEGEVSLSAPGDGVKYAENELVTITLTAAEGYVISALKINGEPVVMLADTYAFHITGRTYAVAEFVAVYETSVTYESAKGSVTLNGDAYTAPKTYREGTKITLAITPEEGYEVASVYVNGGYIAVTENTVEFVLTQKTEVKINFAALYTLDVTAGEGGSYTITPDQDTYREGSEVLLTVTVKEGYAVSVKVNGEAASLKNGALTLVLTRNTEVEIEFTQIKHTVLVLLNNNSYGSATVEDQADDNQYAYGSSLALTLTAKEGYYLYSVTVNGKTVETEDGKLTLTVKEDLTVYVAFRALARHSVKVDHVGEGEVEVTPSLFSDGLYYHGQQVTVTAAAEGKVVYIAVDGGEKLPLAGGEYVLVAEADVAITIWFEDPAVLPAEEFNPAAAAKAEYTAAAGSAPALSVTEEGKLLIDDKEVDLLEDGEAYAFATEEGTEYTLEWFNGIPGGLLVLTEKKPATISLFALTAETEGVYYYYLEKKGDLSALYTYYVEGEDVIVLNAAEKSFTHDAVTATLVTMVEAEGTSHYFFLNSETNIAYCISVNGLTLSYAEKEYHASVKLTLDVVHGGEPAESYVPVGVAYTFPEALEDVKGLSNYAFLGWKVNEAEELHDPETAYTPEADFTVTAVWQEYYILQLEVENGGKVTLTVDGEEVTAEGEIKINKGSSWSVLAEAQEGNWRIRDLSLQQQTADGEAGRAPLTVEAVGEKSLNKDFETTDHNLKLWVLFAETYKVTIDYKDSATPNGEGFAWKSQYDADQHTLLETADGAYILPEAPEYTGYTFLGWKVNGETQQAETKVTLTADTTIEAEWELSENAAIVTWNTVENAAVSVKNDDAEVQSGQAITKGTQLTLTVTVTAEEKYRVVVKVNSGEPLTAGEDGAYTIEVTDTTEIEITLIQTFTVTVEYNGHGGEDKTETVDKDASYTLPTPTEEADWEFLGWKVNEEQELKQEGSITVTADTVLSAQWKEKKQIVEFTEAGITLGEDAVILTINVKVKGYADLEAVKADLQLEVGESKYDAVSAEGDVANVVTLKYSLKDLQDGTNTLKLYSKENETSYDKIASSLTADTTVTLNNTIYTLSLAEEQLTLNVLKKKITGFTGTAFNKDGEKIYIAINLTVEGFTVDDLLTAKLKIGNLEIPARSFGTTAGVIYFDILGGEGDSVASLEVASHDVTLELAGQSYVCPTNAEGQIQDPISITDGDTTRTYTLKVEGGKLTLTVEETVEVKKEVTGFTDSNIVNGTNEFDLYVRVKVSGYADPEAVKADLQLELNGNKYNALGATGTVADVVVLQYHFTADQLTGLEEKAYTLTLYSIANERSYNKITTAVSSVQYQGTIGTTTYTLSIEGEELTLTVKTETEVKKEITGFINANLVRIDDTTFDLYIRPQTVTGYTTEELQKFELIINGKHIQISEVQPGNVWRTRINVQTDLAGITAGTYAVTLSGDNQTWDKIAGAADAGSIVCGTTTYSLSVVGEDSPKTLNLIIAEESKVSVSATEAALAAAEGKVTLSLNVTIAGVDAVTELKLVVGDQEIAADSPDELTLTGTYVFDLTGVTSLAKTALKLKVNGTAYEIGYAAELTEGNTATLETKTYTLTADGAVLSLTVADSGSPQVGSIENTYGLVLNENRLIDFWVQLKDTTTLTTDEIVLVMNDEPTEIHPQSCTPNTVQGQFHVIFSVDSLDVGTDASLQIQYHGVVYNFPAAEQKSYTIDNKVYTFDMQDGKLHLTVTLPASDKGTPLPSVGNEEASSGIDGWSYYNNGAGRNVEAFEKDGVVTINFSGNNNDGNWWAIQIYYADKNLSKDDQYTVSFDITSTEVGKIRYFENQAWNQEIEFTNENNKTVHFESKVSTLLDKGATVKLYLANLENGDGLIPAGTLTISNLTIQKTAAAPVYTATGADIEKDDTHVYVVISGTSEGYEKEALKSALEALDHDFQMNGMAANGTWVGNRKDKVKATVTVDVQDDGTWTMKFDVTSFEPYAYQMHLGGTDPKEPADLKIEDTANNNKVVTLGDKRYTLINRYGQDQGENYWGLVGVRIVDLKPTVTFEKGDGEGQDPVLDFGSMNDKDIYTITLPENPYTAPANKYFRGWQVSEIVYFPGEQLDLHASTAYTLTAIWEDLMSKSVDQDFTVLKWFSDGNSKLTLTNGMGLELVAKATDSNATNWHGIIPDMNMTVNGTNYWLHLRVDGYVWTATAANSNTDDNLSALIKNTKFVAEDYIGLYADGKAPTHKITASLSNNVLTYTYAVYAAEDTQLEESVTEITWEVTSSVPVISLVIGFMYDDGGDSMAITDGKAVVSSYLSEQQSATQDKPLSLSTVVYVPKLWTTDLRKGEKLTLQGSITLTAESLDVWDGPLASLYQNLIATGIMRLDHFLLGVSDVTKNPAFDEDVEGLHYVCEQTGTLTKGKTYSLTLEFDYTTEGKIVYTATLSADGDQYVSAWTVTPMAEKTLADVYRVDVGGEDCTMTITSLQRTSGKLGGGAEQPSEGAKVTLETVNKRENEENTASLDKETYQVGDAAKVTLNVAEGFIAIVEVDGEAAAQFESGSHTYTAKEISADQSITVTFYERLENTRSWNLVGSQFGEKSLDYPWQYFDDVGEDGKVNVLAYDTKDIADVDTYDFLHEAEPFAVYSIPGKSEVNWSNVKQVIRDAIVAKVNAKELEVEVPLDMTFAMALQLVPGTELQAQGYTDSLLIFPQDTALNEVKYGKTMKFSFEKKDLAAPNDAQVRDNHNNALEFVRGGWGFESDGEMFTGGYAERILFKLTNGSDEIYLGLYWENENDLAIYQLNGEEGDKVDPAKKLLTVNGLKTSYLMYGSFNTFIQGLDAEKYADFTVQDGSWTLSTKIIVKAGNDKYLYSGDWSSAS